MEVAANSGGTPLFIVALNGQAQAVAALLAVRARIDIAENNGFTALLAGALAGNIAALVSVGCHWQYSASFC